MMIQVFPIPYQTRDCWIEVYLAVKKEKCSLQLNATSKHVEQVTDEDDKYNSNSPPFSGSSYYQY